MIKDYQLLSANHLLGSNSVRNRQLVDLEIEILRVENILDSLLRSMTQTKEEIAMAVPSFLHRLDHLEAQMAALLTACHLPEKQHLLHMQPAQARVHRQQLERELVALRRAAEVWLWVDLGARATPTSLPAPPTTWKQPRVQPSVNAGDADQLNDSEQNETPRASAPRHGAPARPSFAVVPGAVIVVQAEADID
eukprot:gnl/TRDRNA2_/TRDRNA2_173543_c1_seq5.p1 gnl/TRDRNA2_/TRDRNA2_173543_c1~~gnl/TRDRNA2_/TRDRNA2_173543_c1_seq5.p1  ORF type:complete len:194 (+),score=21.05 gnl/TRDRNA2_/TRDRNA2_173543_c1_seq5:206-787(+)